MKESMDVSFLNYPPADFLSGPAKSPDLIECPLCDYSSQSKANFKKHQLKHIGKKSFRCRLCHYNSNYKSDLKRHMKVHLHNPSIFPSYANEHPRKSAQKDLAPRPTSDAQISASFDSIKQQVKMYLGSNANESNGSSTSNNGAANNGSNRNPAAASSTSNRSAAEDIAAAAAIAAAATFKELSRRGARGLLAPNFGSNTGFPPEIKIENLSEFTAPNLAAQRSNARQPIVPQPIRPRPVASQPIRPRPHPIAPLMTGPNRSRSDAPIRPVPQVANPIDVAAASALLYPRVANTLTAGQTAERQINTEGIPSYMKGEEKCVVCDDAATGIHYDVMSCEACKGFFRRAIQQQIPIDQLYSCPQSENCEMNKRSRSRCKRCRLLKCLRVGMIPKVTFGVPGSSGEESAQFLEPPLPAPGLVPTLTQLPFAALLPSVPIAAAPANPKPSTSAVSSPMPPPASNSLRLSTKKTTPPAAAPSTSAVKPAPPLASVPARPRQLSISQLERPHPKQGKGKEPQAKRLRKQARPQQYVLSSPSECLQTWSTHAGSSSSAVKHAETGGGKSDVGTGKESIGANATGNVQGSAFSLTSSPKAGTSSMFVDEYAESNDDGNGGLKSVRGSAFSLPSPGPMWCATPSSDQTDKGFDSGENGGDSGGEGSAFSFAPSPEQMRKNVDVNEKEVAKDNDNSPMLLNNDRSDDFDPENHPVKMDYVDEEESENEDEMIYENLEEDEDEEVENEGEVENEDVGDELEDDGQDYESEEKEVEGVEVYAKEMIEIDEDGKRGKIWLVCDSDL